MPSNERKMVLIAVAAASRGRSRKRMRAVKAPSANMPPIQATRAAAIVVSMSGSHFVAGGACSFSGDRAEQVFAVGLAGGDEREHIERQADEPLVAQVRVTNSMSPSTRSTAQRPNFG